MLEFSAGVPPTRRQQAAQFAQPNSQNARIRWRFDQIPMDDVDQQLLSLLREDARASVASLAKTLRVARGTVQNRIAKLQANGTIVGYTVRLKPQTEAN